MGRREGEGGRERGREGERKIKREERRGNDLLTFRCVFSGKEETGRPCGVQWELRIYVGTSAEEQPQRRSCVRLLVRWVLEGGREGGREGRRKARKKEGKEVGREGRREIMEGREREWKKGKGRRKR